MVYNELRHHGVKGQRWGIRRFQQKDGSLTPLGKRRRRKGEDPDDSESTKKEAKAKPKSYKDMTDDELKSNIERMRLEKTYKDLDREVNPQTVSRGKKFVNDFIDKAVIPGVTRAGEEVIRKAATKYGSKALGLDEEKTKDTVAEMQKEIKKYNTEKTYKKMMEEKAAEKEAAKSDKKSKVDDFDTDESKDEPDDSREETSTRTETAKEKVNKARKPSNNDTIIDVDFTEVDEETVAAGKSYALAILKELDK